MACSAFILSLALLDSVVLNATLSKYNISVVQQTNTSLTLNQSNYAINITSLPVNGTVHFGVMGKEYVDDNADMIQLAGTDETDGMPTIYTLTFYATEEETPDVCRRIAKPLTPSKPSEGSSVTVEAQGLVELWGISYSLPTLVGLIIMVLSLVGILVYIIGHKKNRVRIAPAPNNRLCR